MRNLPRLWIDVVKLQLVRRNRLSLSVKNDESGRGGTLINGSNEFLLLLVYSDLRRHDAGFRSQLSLGLAGVLFLNVEVFWLVASDKAVE